MIQSCLLEGGRIDSRPTDGCGMGVFPTVCNRDRSQARAASRRSPTSVGWHFLDCTYGRTMARSARRIGKMELRLSPVPTMDACRALGPSVGDLSEKRGRSRYASNDRLHHRPGAPPRSWRKGGFRGMLLAVRAVGSRPKYISARTRKASRSVRHSRRAKRTTSKATRRG